MSEPAGNPSAGDCDYAGWVDALTRHLKLRTIPIGMKRFKTRAEMEAIPSIRRPRAKMTFDQIVGQARLVGYTVGVTYEDLIGSQCGTPIGLHPRNEQFLAGSHMVGVWYGTAEDAAAHQAAMDVAADDLYEAVAVSPLASGRLDPPEICLIYGTPGQMIFFVNGLQYTGYRKLQFSCVGESACADSWGRALKTGEPSLSIPCFAERRFGGVADDELLMALPPRFLPKVIEGLEHLGKNGFRYPFSPWGIQASPVESFRISYPDRKF
jgi:uncharacterized protein (DUF169 family)